MKKNQLRGIAVLGILLLAFIVISFAVPFAKTGVFWVAFLFGIIAIGVSGGGCYLAFHNGEDARSKFYGFPIAKTAVVYAAVQLVISLLCMALAKILPLWVEVLVDVLLLAAAAIGMIAADSVRDEIHQQDSALKKDVANMQELRSKVSHMVGLCENVDMKAAVQKLSDRFKYSDPVSSDTTAAIEGELKISLDELQKAVVDGDTESVKTLCRQIETTLSERNRLCKLGK